MKTIPLHDFPGTKTLPRFEVMPWSKEVDPYDATLPHRHNYYEILVFLKGKGSHEIDFTTYKFTPVALHFVSANCVHLVKRFAGSDGFSILFAPEFLPPGCLLHDFSFYKANASPVLNVAKNEFSLISPLLDTIIAEYNSNKKMKREALQSLFHVLLVNIQRLYEEKQSVPQRNTTKQEFVVKFEKLLDENYGKHWRAGDYADALNMSVANLSAQCRQHFSRNAEKLIQERLLLEIKRQLAYSDKPIKEICYELNFEDPAYFNRFFKKHTGATPLNYRHALKH